MKVPFVEFMRRHHLTLEEMSRLSGESLGTLMAVEEGKPIDPDSTTKLVSFMLDFEKAQAEKVQEEDESETRSNSMLGPLLHPPLSAGVEPKISPAERREREGVLNRYINNEIRIRRASNGYIIECPFPSNILTDALSAMKAQEHVEYVCPNPDALTWAIMLWAQGRRLKDITKEAKR